MPIIALFGAFFMGIERSIGGPDPSRHDGAAKL
jgi:hypothetical protein